MSYDKQIWNKYDDLKTEEENIENGAVVTDDRMNHIEDGVGASDNALSEHIANRNNPHVVTKEQIGLGNVDNLQQASKTVVDAHLSDLNNPHGVTSSQVGAYSKVEADSQFASKVTVEGHIGNTSNPHNTTAAQVGAYSKPEIDSNVVHQTLDETIAGKKSFTDAMSVTNLNVTGTISTLGDTPLTKVTNFNSGWSGNAYYKVRNGYLTLNFQGVSSPSLPPAGSSPFSIPGVNFSQRSITTNGYVSASGTIYQTKVDFNASAINISNLAGTTIAAQSGGLWLSLTQEII